MRLPSDFDAALAAAPDARHYFESLRDSRQRWFVDRIEDARIPEIRRNRIDHTIRRLRDA
jgi:uncharacterized protein YdeI (YjbR/CyaY-like superfamily)